MSGLISSKSWGGPRANSGGARANSGGARIGAGRKAIVILKPAARQPDPVPAIPDDAEPRWFCVRTHHGAELTADIEIRLADFTVFAPTLFKPATPARRIANGALRAAQPDRIVPLFRRYLFVQFRRGADYWQKIRALAGVEQILGTTPELPTAVSDTAITLIRGMCAPNGCLYPASHHDLPLAVGMNARFLTGPMADLTGICAWSDGRRVKLLLEIMGRPVAVTVAQAAVEVVT